MKEEFLHYLWKHKKIPFQNLYTEDNKPIEILNWGYHNLHSGPDFKESIVKIGDTTWAGQVEMHLKASDWYAHNHQNDNAYNNVILHVVWEYDQDVMIHGQPLPVLVLKGKIPNHLLRNYKNLLKEKNTIVCQDLLPKVEDKLWNKTLKSKVAERIESKVQTIRNLMNNFTNDRKRVAQIILARGFGMKLNKDAMTQLAMHFPFQQIEKFKNEPDKIYAISFGMAGWLEVENASSEWQKWQTEYNHIKNVFQLDFQMKKEQWLLGRLRPANFPTIRLAQWTALLIQMENVYTAVNDWSTKKWKKELDDVELPEFWKSHYLPSRQTENKFKKIGDNLKNHLLINTIIPLRTYFNELDQKQNEENLKMLQEIPAEKNTITKKYIKLEKSPENAMESQAQIQLYKYYCQPKRCLDCEVGQSILKKT